MNTSDRSLFSCSLGPEMPPYRAEGQQRLQCHFLPQAEQEAAARQPTGEESILAREAEMGQNKAEHQGEQNYSPFRPAACAVPAQGKQYSQQVLIALGCSCLSLLPGTQLNSKRHAEHAGCIQRGLASRPHSQVLIDCLNFLRFACLPWDLVLTLKCLPAGPEDCGEGWSAEGGQRTRRRSQQAAIQGCATSEGGIPSK